MSNEFPNNMKRNVKRTSNGTKNHGEQSLIHFILALLLIGCANGSTSHAQIDDSKDAVLLLKMASQGYIQGTRKVASLVDNAALARISNEKSELSDLASLISARVVINAAHQKENNRGWQGESEITRGAIKEAAISTVKGEVIQRVSFKGLELLGIAVHPAVPVILVVKDVVQLVLKAAEASDKIEAWRDAQGALVQQYRHAAWVYEGLIATEIKNLLEKSSTRGTEFDRSFSVTPTGYKSGRRPFSAFKVSNKTARPFRWAVVILRIDCEYKIKGNALGHSELDKAFEKSSNVDKVIPFFIQNWHANQSITIVGPHAPEYFHTAKAVELFVFTPDKLVKRELDIKSHKQSLIRNFGGPSGVRPMVDSN